MSLMSLGYKISSLEKGIENGMFTTKEQVKEAAMGIDIAGTASYESLSPEDKELWYEQLAVNLFEKHNNWIPCFIDIGFGKELLDHSSEIWNHSVPKKQYWKIVVTREKFSEWQFNGIVASYSKEEAVCILKRFFNDFGELGFKYDNSSQETENKVPWIEINAKKPGTYIEYLKTKS